MSVFFFVLFFLYECLCILKVSPIHFVFNINNESYLNYGIGEIFTLQWVFTITYKMSLMLGKELC